MEEKWHVCRRIRALSATCLMGMKLGFGLPQRGISVSMQSCQCGCHCQHQAMQVLHSVERRTLNISFRAEVLWASFLQVPNNPGLERNGPLKILPCSLYNLQNVALSKGSSIISEHVVMKPRTLHFISVR